MSKKTKRSSGSVAKAWTIFAKHPKDRAAALEAAARAGVNPNTAKTQWQRFLHSSKAEREKKVNGKEKKQEATQS